MSEGLAKLREPFPPETVGKLPRITCKDCRDAQWKVCSKHTQVQCQACGNKITEKHMHLDYVGHAEVTDRLLSVDPAWSWEPVAWTEAGAPLIAKGASGEWTMWIRLTVLGVTRLGVGSVGTGFDAEKQLIGDALRNAAMRFGVALDLWSKSELESASEAANPPPSDEGKALRQRVRTRISDLSPEQRQAVGAWCDTNSTPRKTSDMNDDQLDALVGYLDSLELGGEAAVSPVEPPEQVGATTPHEPDRYAAAAAFVTGLSKTDLVANLADYKLEVPRGTDAQREALVAAIVNDESWQPNQEKLAL